MKIVASAFFGIVFGLGLLVSGMTDPARVIAFLDVAGAWNPALALVMGAAVVVALPAFAIARRGASSVLGGPIELPDRFHIDARVVGGAAVFGLGWDLVGICPGPALVLLGLDLVKAGAFVAALIAGAWIAGYAPSRRPAAGADSSIRSAS